MDWLWFLLLGFGTGAYGVLVGAGGGFILGPILLIFFLDGPEVVAGTTLALVAVNTLSGSVAYWRMRLIDYRSGLMFAGAGIPGAVLAPFVLASIAEEAFQVLFGALLLTLGLYLARPKPFGGAGSGQAETRRAGLTKIMVARRRIVTARDDVFEYEYSGGLATVFSFMLGFIASFFGVGAGFLRTPALVYAFGFPVRVAVATSVFTLSFIAAAGALTHLSQGNIDAQAFLWAGIGLVSGAQLGALLSFRIRGVWIIRLLAVLLLVLGVRLVVLGFYE